ncbi:MAG: hypothetical protein DKM50_03945 [Candidatus Margulisiibacteriota bacterium]|nr:MAG: hypothetical protein A2X43_01660 [Candidatus Margulisbacteria bacterium GWD2_39_127]OGI05508.1 MAG: hypothetical protein A2X42_00175 [Candidatus Margulisbacteria bacterium GWF2_38_17]OGI08294.1 MAG: hypothetical protein A2X41_00070 [Candidatus Margulisbacteria bacterium GWE2_39_32]PZM82288.1 MAG: hypothetical protein DKM50_03945 [Candidatus Margulisiibacteriota bacterium]HAR62966.1 hypothetical protein [Candidatus Margulisiibacteriota bacterium]
MQTKRRSLNKLWGILLIMLIIATEANCELVFSYSNTTAEKFSEIEENRLFIYQLKHQDAIIFSEQLKKIFPEEKIIQYTSNSSIGIYTTTKKYKMIQAFIEKLDCPIDQIKIEVEIIELTNNDINELGIKWNTEKDVEMTNKNLIIADESQFLAKIKMATQYGKARIKANPTLVVKDNCTALVKIGDKVPVAVPDKDKGNYTISYMDAGIKLKINPKIVSENYIVTSIQPEVSSIKGWKTTAAGEYPVISTKEAQTEVKVKSGQIFMIAGLKSNDEKKYNFEVPFLSSLPVIGNLFKFSLKETEDTEIIFCIKPTIIKS